jgi:hypothetical protein
MFSLISSILVDEDCYDGCSGVDEELEFTSFIF